MKGVKCSKCGANFHLVFGDKCPKCKKKTKWVDREYSFEERRNKWILLI